MERGGRNGLIEFLRFLACLFIAMYHFEWLYISHPVYFISG